MLPDLLALLPYKSWQLGYMLSKLENEDMLAPTYFAKKATKITSMIWSSLIARHPHKSLLELQPELRQIIIKITKHANVYTRTASNERYISNRSLAILLIHGSTSLQHNVSPCAPIRWIQLESIISSQSHRKCEPWKCQNPLPEHNR